MFDQEKPGRKTSGKLIPILLEILLQILEKWEISYFYNFLVCCVKTQILATPILLEDLQNCTKTNKININISFVLKIVTQFCSNFYEIVKLTHSP